MIEQMMLNKLISGIIKQEPWAIEQAARLPKLIDSVYGDGNGTLSVSDVDDIVANIASSIGEKASVVGNVLSKVIPNAGETISNIGDTITGMGDTAASALAATGSTIAENSDGILDNLGDTISEGFSWLVDIFTS